MKHLNLRRVVISIFLIWGLSLFSFGSGEKVGYVTDYLGNVKEELRAPFSGIILYIVYTPPVSKGEPLYEVGRVKQ